MIVEIKEISRREATDPPLALDSERREISFLSCQTVFRRNSTELHIANISSPELLCASGRRRSAGLFAQECQPVQEQTIFGSHLRNFERSLMPWRVQGVGADMTLLQI